MAITWKQIHRGRCETCKANAFSAEDAPWTDLDWNYDCEDCFDAAAAEDELAAEEECAA